MRIQLLRGTSCLFLILLAGSASGQDTAVIGPPYRFEPAVDEDWWGLEHVGAARRVFDDTTNVWRSEVVVAWMRDRNDQMDSPARTVRLGFSGDAGTTWTFQDFQSPISIHEYDPMAAFDPVTESLYVGSMAGGQRDYISRLDAEDHLLAEFGELQRLFSGSTQAHRPSAGAGPKPGALTESRVYVSAYFDLKWSDDLGAQASWKGPIAVGQGIQSWAVPRIGNAGELYLAHRFGIGENAHVRLDRSTSLDADTDETPLFLAETVVATTDGNLDPTWLASNLRLTDVVGCAVAPHDGKRVYVVWMDKTSEADNGCGATNHNIDLYFSMTTDATVANPTWTTKKIVPAGVEVPGDQFYPWLEATTYQDGTETNTRLHLVWYDSRQMPDQCDTGATDNSFWFDAYYAYSDDEGATWNESRLTEDSMNTIHSLETFDRVTNFYGDYIGMAVVGKRAFPLYSIATSIDEPPSDPLGWSEVYTNMIVFGNVPSYTDFTITEGTLQSADDLSLITHPITSA